MFDCRDQEKKAEAYYLKISNRHFRDISDVNGRLCRLTSAFLSLLDDEGMPVASKILGNTFRCSPHEYS